MTLVEMEHARADPEERQCAHPADAKQDLLTKPRVLVSSMGVPRAIAVLWIVLAEAGIQKIARTPPDLSEPDLAPHPTTAAEGNLHRLQGAILVTQEIHRHVIECEC